VHTPVPVRHDDDEDQADELAKQRGMGEQRDARDRGRPSRPLRLTAPRPTGTTKAHTGMSGRGRSSSVPHLTRGACIPGAVMVFLPDDRVKARFALRP
jgi:hypothetical protein